jgi:hypothetical protein
VRRELEREQEDTGKLVRSKVTGEGANLLSQDQDEARKGRYYPDRPSHQFLST